MFSGGNACKIFTCSVLNASPQWWEWPAIYPNIVCNLSAAALVDRHLCAVWEASVTLLSTAVSQTPLLSFHQCLFVSEPPQNIPRLPPGPLIGRKPPRRMQLGAWSLREKRVKKKKKKEREKTSPPLLPNLQIFTPGEWPQSHSAPTKPSSPAVRSKNIAFQKCVLHSHS